MQNLYKNSLQRLLKVCLILTLLVPVAPGFSTTPMVCLVCPDPGPNITLKSGNSIAFGWSEVAGAVSYSAWYRKHEDNFTSSVFNTSSTNITFSGLSPGTYDFYFVTNCGDGTSEIIIVVDIVMQ